jgi:hypothetical protein
LVWHNARLLSSEPDTPEPATPCKLVVATPAALKLVRTTDALWAFVLVVLIVSKASSNENLITGVCARATLPDHKHPAKMATKARIERWMLGRTGLDETVRTTDGW